MRIVLMIDWFLYYSVELVNALSEEHDVLLVTRDHSHEIAPGSRQLDVEEFLNSCLDPRVHRETLRFRQRNPRNVFEVLRIYRKIRVFRPQIIHVQDNADWRIAFIACLFGSRRLVLTIHDVVPHPGKQTKIFKPIRLFFWKRSRMIIVHGKKLKEMLVSLAPALRDRIRVIPHGTFTIYRKWDDGSIQEEPGTMLFFGYISKYKGIGVLIEAQPWITREIPEAKVLIVGTGKEFEKYKAAVRMNPSFEVHNEFVPTEDVHRYFRKASVVVLPYIEASQSGIIPLAYAFGKPVVATDVGSLAEVVENGKTGFIVPPNNPGKLAEAVVTILKDPELRSRMGRNALEKAATDLSWRTIAAETVRVYASMIGHE
jgi:starch synthase